MSLLIETIIQPSCNFSIRVLGELASTILRMLYFSCVECLQVSQNNHGEASSEGKDHVFDEAFSPLHTACCQRSPGVMQHAVYKSNANANKRNHASINTSA